MPSPSPIPVGPFELSGADVADASEDTDEPFDVDLSGEEASGSMAPDATSGTGQPAGSWVSTNDGDSADLAEALPAGVEDTVGVAELARYG